MAILSQVFTDEAAFGARVARLEPVALSRWSQLWARQDGCIRHVT